MLTILRQCQPWITVVATYDMTTLPVCPPWCPSSLISNRCRPDRDHLIVPVMSVLVWSLPMQGRKGIVNAGAMLACARSRKFGRHTAKTGQGSTPSAPDMRGAFSGHARRDLKQRWLLGRPNRWPSRPSTGPQWSKVVQARGFIRLCRSYPHGEEGNRRRPVTDAWPPAHSLTYPP